MDLKRLGATRGRTLDRAGNTASRGPRGPAYGPLAAGPCQPKGAGGAPIQLVEVAAEPRWREPRAGQHSL